MRCLVGLVLVFVACSGFAQQDSTQKVSRLNIGVGFGLNTWKDDMVSALRYDGTYPEVVLGWEEFKTNYRFTINGSFQRSTISNASALTDRDEPSQLTRFDLNTFLQWPILKSTNLNWDFYAGVGNQTHYSYNLNDEFNNAGLTYSGFTALGPNLSVEKSWTRKSKSKKLWFLKWQRKARKLTLNNTLSTNLVGVGMRPQYQVISPFSSAVDWGNIDESKTVFFGLPNQIFSVSNQLDFTWNFTNVNAIRLSYCWDYYRVENRKQSGENTIQQANNGLLISILMAL